MSNNRTDLELITSLVDEETRILDVGCGNGELLQSLKDKKNVKGQGLELKQERVNQCVS
jgi:methionine biosynthesis protein MetW